MSHYLLYIGSQCKWVYLDWSKRSYLVINWNSTSGLKVFSTYLLPIYFDYTYVTIFTSDICLKIRTTTIGISWLSSDECLCRSWTRSGWRPPATNSELRSVKTWWSCLFLIIGQPRPLLFYPIYNLLLKLLKSSQSEFKFITYTAETDERKNQKKW